MQNGYYDSYEHDNKESVHKVFRFPQNKDLQKLWVKNMKRENFIPSRTSVICSDHFEDKCFNKYGNNVTLKPGSAPTKFDFPKHLTKKVYKRTTKSSLATITEESDVKTQQPLNCRISTEPAAEPHNSQIVSKTSSFDHSYSVKESPRYLKKKLNQAIDKIGSVKKSLKFKQQQNRRLKRKVDSLTSVVKALLDKRLISKNCSDVLEKTFSGLTLELMKRLIKKKNDKLTRESYPDVLKSFALTLQFYSTKAYNYVRKTFQLALPHPSTLQRWYSSRNGNPGFSQEALTALKLKSNEKPVICSLMIDEMAIKKHIEWNGKRMVGFVDIGTNVDDDSAPIASEALVFMLVSLDSSWKVPVGYFFINGMSGEERANLINQCLRKVFESNVQVVALICDGPACHFAMMKSLGVSMDPSDLNPYFQHPVDSSLIYVFLDICHMIKLLRNCLAVGGIIVNKDGGLIKWKYFEDLHKLQEKEGLRLGNKLRATHINWRTQKMKVNLATQTISSSVADAIKFCTKNLQLSQFEGSAPTVEFIEIYDRLFDLLNSRNPLAKGFKAPLRKNSESFWLPFLEEAYTYTANLKDTTGILMTASRRKTPFIGFMCAIKGIIELYKSLVQPESSRLKYLLTYKLSQDHLELFFGSVRAAGGCNNNPTVNQFTATYKKLLMLHEIKSDRGNCIAQDNTNILDVLREASSINQVSTDTLHISNIRRYDMEERSPEAYDHDYVDVPNMPVLSEYLEAAIGYIAGYVVRMVQKKIHCTRCTDELTDKPGNHLRNPLVDIKTRGGLIYASSSVYDVCKKTELVFQRLLKTTNGNLPQASRVHQTISHTVLQEIVTGTTAFSSLHDHMFESTAESNHVFILIKCISESYCCIRLHHLAKQYNVSMTGEQVRKKYSKLVLFKHQ